MKTLYEAGIDVRFYLLAETDEEARLDALSYAREEMDNVISMDVEIIREPEDIYVGWENAYPYGGKDGDVEMTVGELFRHIKERKKQERLYREYLKKQGNLFSGYFSGKETL